MQFQVPQFIETEDKIVGPLTLRQFFYIGAMVGLSFLLFFMVKTWLWLILTLLMVAVGGSMAFIKINGRPFTTIMLSALKFYWQPQTYVWKSDKPTLDKSEVKKDEEIKKMARPGLSIENIVMGLSLKGKWQKLQTGTKESLTSAKQFSEKVKEKYQILEKITGERKAARRVDYR